MINKYYSGIYVHFPFCKSKCGYCNFVSGTDFTLLPEYIECVKKEIELNKSSEAVDSVYFGGGTPSALPIFYLLEVLNKIKECFLLTKDCEITIECNPESVSGEFVHFCASEGVNRVSIGVQSACDNVLKNAGRIHTFNDAKSAVHQLYLGGIKNISCDIMLGLPSQDIASALETVNQICNLPVSHISMYGLKVEEGTAFFKNGYVTDDDVLADMYEACCKAIIEKGFSRYEVSNFAKNNTFSRHNYKYWLRKDYYGFGAAAHSFYSSKRVENVSSVKEYILGNIVASEVIITKQEALQETIMLALRTAQGVCLSELKDEFNYDLMSHKKNEINLLILHDLVGINRGYLKLTDKAFYVMNSVILKLIS